MKKSMTGASKEVYDLFNQETVTMEEIKVGCLQRMANSLEGIHSQLMYMNNRKAYNEKANNMLREKNRVLRKKLKEMQK